MEEKKLDLEITEREDYEPDYERCGSCRSNPCVCQDFYKLQD